MWQILFGCGCTLHFKRRWKTFDSLISFGYQASVMPRVRAAKGPTTEEKRLRRDPNIVILSIPILFGAYFVHILFHVSTDWYYQIRNHRSFCLHTLALLKTFTARCFDIGLFCLSFLLSLCVRCACSILFRRNSKETKQKWKWNDNKGSRKKAAKKNYKTNNVVAAPRRKQKKDEANERKSQTERNGFSLYIFFSSIFFFKRKSGQSFES